MKRFLSWLSTQHLILSILVVVPIAFLWVGYFYEDLTIKLFLLQLAVIALVFVQFKNRVPLDQLIRKDGINFALLAFFVWLLVSVVFALDPQRALSGSPSRYDGYSTFLIYALLFLSARTLKTIPTSWRKWILLSASLAACYGIAQSFGLDYLPSAIRFGNAPQVVAWFGNPNFFGIYLVLMLPIAYGTYLELGRKGALVAFGLLLYALLASRTMGAWIGAVAGLIMYGALNRFWLNRSIKGKSLLILSSVALVVVLAFNMFNLSAFSLDILRLGQDISEVAKEGQKAETAGSFRIFIWSRVVPMIQERPWTGFGIENMGLAFETRYGQDMSIISSTLTTFDHAHNEYLHYAVTSGLPALLAYLVWVGQILLTSLKGMRKDPSRLVLVSAVIGYLTQALFASSVLYVAYVFWIFMGLIVPNSLDEI